MARTRLVIASFAIVSLGIVVFVVIHNRQTPTPAVVGTPGTAEWAPFPPGYGEKVQRITALLESAPTSRPSNSDAAEMIDLALHGSDFRIRVRAMAVLPFVGDREKAIDALIACVHDRGPEASGGGNVPLYAASYLADMRATRAIPDVEDWIAFLHQKPSYDEKVRSMILEKSSDDLARLKQSAATRPAP